jgi:hypothetical protein
VDLCFCQDDIAVTPFHAHNPFVIGILSTNPLRKNTDGCDK